MTDLDHRPAPLGADGAHPGATSDHELRERRREARRLAQRRTNITTLVVMLAAVGFLVGTSWMLVLPLFNQPQVAQTQSAPADFPGPGSGAVEVVVAADTSVEELAAALVDAGVVAGADMFVAAAAGAQASFEPGTYVLSREMAAVDALMALTDASNRIDLTLTVTARSQTTQILAKVAEVLGMSVDDVVLASDALALPEGAADLEGWLAAGTYTVQPGSDAAEVLQLMIDRTVSELEGRGVDPSDWQDTLTQASVVEAEVSDPVHRGQVARVIANRFAGCTDSGRPVLQMVSTVAYGLGTTVFDVTPEDTRDADNPYNTYQFEGLPPGAINSPSEESIDAVLDPPAGDWCYFTSVNLETGEVRFTADAAEHSANVNEYRAWREQFVAEQSAASGEG